MRGEKGVRNLLPGRPFRCSAQKVPDPFFSWLAAGLLAAALAAGCGREALAPMAGWGDDLAAAKAEACAARRPLAVLFSAPWSDVAGEFEERVLTDAAVRKQLDRFVRVRLNLDLDQNRALETEYAVAGVPCLVLLSRADDAKKAERRSIPGRCSAPELAEFLATLGEWGELHGWESDRAAAKTKADQSGRPLATLYSAAWEPQAAAFEQLALGDARVKAALANFTPLRLNLAANAESAKADKVDPKSPFALVLPVPGPAGERRMIAENCPPEALVAFIESLSGWKETPGWNPDRAAVERAKAEKRPVALVLDSAASWPSAKLLHVVLGDEKVRNGLQPFVKVRLEYDKVPDPDRDQWRARGTAPCLVLLDGKGELYSVYGMSAKATARELAGKIAEGLKRAAEPKGSY